MSLLVGHAHIPAALCMRRMMLRVGSVCPHTLVYDDVNAPLRSQSFGALASAYGKGRLISTSSLQARVLRAHGRRLLTATNLNQTFLKRYLWALPPRLFPRLLALDLDMLPLVNLDAYISQDLEGPLLVKPCGDGFSTGFFYFRPNISEVRRIERFLGQRAKIPKVCEPTATDQSIFNAAFAGRYLTRSPHLLSNMNEKPLAKVKCSARIIHFSDPRYI